MSGLFAGLDLGTSGSRLCIIDEGRNIVAAHRIDYANPALQTAQDWWRANRELIAATGPSLRQRIRALAVDGTSGSLLLTDASGQVMAGPLLYNDHDAGFDYPLKTQHPASDTMVRALRLLKRAGSSGGFIVSQADYIKGKFTGNFQLSDVNNAFKLGYDSMAKNWPAIFPRYGIERNMLPEVLKPGSIAGQITPAASRTLGLNPHMKLVAGTTDSIAAVLATGCNRAGQAITSLGTTLVVKVISPSPVNNRKLGVYSQPYGEYWLVGGASNCGAGVLRQFFDNDELDKLSGQIDPSVPSKLDYYPLTCRGERFPVNDPCKHAVLQPRPENDIAFLHGLFESLARIEAEAYQLLEELGAPQISEVLTVGGGSCNPQWTAIRRRLIGRPVKTAAQTEAAYGAALLAKRGFQDG